MKLNLKTRKTKPNHWCSFLTIAPYYLIFPRLNPSGKCCHLSILWDPPLKWTDQSHYVPAALLNCAPGRGNGMWTVLRWLRNVGTSIIWKNSCLLAKHVGVMLQVSAALLVGSEWVSNVPALQGVGLFCNCHCTNNSSI